MMLKEHLILQRVRKLEGSLSRGKNKKVIGLMKNELGGKISFRIETKNI